MTRKLISIEHNRLMVQLLKLAKTKYLKIPRDGREDDGMYLAICHCIEAANYELKIAHCDKREDYEYLTDTICREISRKLGRWSYFSSWWLEDQGIDVWNEGLLPEVQRHRHVWMDRMIKTYERRIKKWEKANAQAG